VGRKKENCLRQRGEGREDLKKTGRHRRFGSLKKNGDLKVQSNGSGGGRKPQTKKKETHKARGALDHEKRGASRVKFISSFRPKGRRVKQEEFQRSLSSRNRGKTEVKNWGQMDLLSKSKGR